MIATATNTTNPTWLDTSLYPFEAKEMKLKAGRMHYVDEGEGEVLLFVHGTPTWSFLYREYIRELSKNYRCIAIDHIGFGLSDKPKDFAGTPQAHSENLEAFIDQLQLENVTLIVHDFGGPIGLSCAISQPEKFKRIVLFNSWLWETASNKDAQKVDGLINSFIGRWLYLYLNFSPNFLIRQGFDDKKKLSKNIHDHYKNVFPKKDSRYAPYRIAQALVGASDWYAQQWQKLDRITDKPFLILWGNRDQFLGKSFLEKWKKRIPRAKVHEFYCGHFVQEEKTKESLEVLKEFLASHSTY